MSKKALLLSALFLFLVIFSSSVYSQLNSVDALWAFEGGALLNVENRDESLGGFAFIATYDQVSPGAELSGGVSFGKLMIKGFAFLIAICSVLIDTFIIKKSWN